MQIQTQFSFHVVTGPTASGVGALALADPTQPDFASVVASGEAVVQAGQDHEAAGRAEGPEPAAERLVIEAAVVPEVVPLAAMNGVISNLPMNFLPTLVRDAGAKETPAAVGSLALDGAADHSEIQPSHPFEAFGPKGRDIGELPGPALAKADLAGPSAARGVTDEKLVDLGETSRIEAHSAMSVAPPDAATANSSGAKMESSAALAEAQKTVPTMAGPEIGRVDRDFATAVNRAPAPSPSPETVKPVLHQAYPTQTAQIEAGSAAISAGRAVGRSGLGYGASDAPVLTLPEGSAIPAVTATATTAANSVLIGDPILADPSNSEVVTSVPVAAVLAEPVSHSVAQSAPAAATSPPNTAALVRTGTAARSQPTKVFNGSDEGAVAVRDVAPVRTDEFLPDQEKDAAVELPPVVQSGKGASAQTSDPSAWTVTNLPSIAPLDLSVGTFGRGEARSVVNAPGGTALAQIIPDSGTTSAPVGISAQIAAALPEKPGTVELVLTPEDLGRIRFEIQQSGDVVRMVLAAERPETLDHIRRHLPEFLTDLRQAGFSGSDVSLGQWSRGSGDNTPAWSGASQDDRSNRQGPGANAWQRRDGAEGAENNPVAASRRNLGLGPGQLAIRL